MVLERSRPSATSSATPSASSWHRWVLWLVLLAGLPLLWSERNALMAWAAPQPHGVVLLIPDDNARAHPVTQAWLDAAQEEGLPLTPMTSDRFVHAVARRESITGVLVPDTVHRHASDVWVQALETHVRRGGHALLSFDAALFGLHQQGYAAPASRLSRLIGFRYALYDALQQDTIALTPVLVHREAQSRMAIQPGKVDFKAPLAQALQPLGEWGELTTYGYAHLMYPHFRSEGPRDAQVWIRSPEGDPVLSLRGHGQGSVLFANLPLGYLKTRTDGYLLHRLLSHFARSVLELPVLSAAPQGIGGLVLNLHVDSNAAEQPMLALEQAGWFEQGPFSIHVTAGPDTFREGDRLGLNMPNNPRMQHLLNRLQAQGHEIGNHGGWVHNVFGEQASDDNADRFVPWLALNQKTLSTIVGQRLVSYSAPMGNHPDWVTAWLREHDFRAYYTAGDSGLGPTRAYRQGRPPAPGTPWAFPISNLQRIATLDELPELGAPETLISEFIRDLAQHVSAQGIVRLFYFHPASAPDYPQSLSVLQQTARALEQQGRFRWYSMQALADFLDRRLAVQWQIQAPADGDMARLHAHSATSLQGMTWVLPKGKAQGLHLSVGQAEIVEDPDQWRVIAGDVQQITLHWQQRQE